MWKFIVLFLIVVVIGLGIYNILSFIRKLKYNPSTWIDLGFGILIWCAGIAGLVYIFIQQL